MLSGKKQVGPRVAIIGAGGIGFDMAAFLLCRHVETADWRSFMTEWGVDIDYTRAGGLKKPEVPKPIREIHLLQRKTTKPGAGLGKTTGWIHRSVLKKNGVRFWNGLEYLRISLEGLTIKQAGQEVLLAVDNVVICAGQVSELGLAAELKAAGMDCHIIGGALEAGELDAERAILQGVELADSL